MRSSGSIVSVSSSQETILNLIAVESMIGNSVPSVRLVTRKVAMKQLCGRSPLATT